MKHRLIAILVIVFVVVFAICFYFLKRNEDSIRNYSKFRLMAGEKEWINREITTTEKQKLRVLLQQSHIRHKDTLGTIYIYNEEFFGRKKPLFLTLTNAILDSTLKK